MTRYRIEYRTFDRSSRGAAHSFSQWLKHSEGNDLVALCRVVNDANHILKEWRVLDLVDNYEVDWLFTLSEQSA
jgi:hypothetical protein